MIGIPIATDNLGFVYPDGTRALSGVNLSIAAGENVAIIGQNGSGKSTLVRHFNGLLRATEGSVLVGGRDVGRRHVAELARQVGISFQNPDRQIFAARAAAEVAFGARNLGARGADLEQRVSNALAAVGLADYAATNPYDLGYSQRKLLALASILAMATPTIVLDEPTTGQDQNGVTRVMAIVRDLITQGRTVVAVSHDMRFVAESFERVVVMRAGRVILDAPTADVFAESNWELLRSTNLAPPYPAVVGAKLGLGSTPRESDVVVALGEHRN